MICCALDLDTELYANFAVFLPVRYAASCQCIPETHFIPAVFLSFFRLRKPVTHSLQESKLETSIELLGKIRPFRRKLEIGTGEDLPVCLQTESIYRASEFEAEGKRNALVAFWIECNLKALVT